MKFPRSVGEGSGVPMYDISDHKGSSYVTRKRVRLCIGPKQFSTVPRQAYQSIGTVQLATLVGDFLNPSSGPNRPWMPRAMPGKRMTRGLVSFGGE